MRVRVLAAVFLAFAAVASAAAADRTVTSPGPVRALARSGYSVAFLSGPYGGHCGGRVVLWNLVTGGVYRLGRHPDQLCKEGPSTGSGITDIAVAGNRALWLPDAGGEPPPRGPPTGAATRARRPGPRGRGGRRRGAPPARPRGARPR